MINKLLRSLLLIDVVKPLVFGLKVAVKRKPLTVRMPKQTPVRNARTRRCFVLDHSKCIQCKICESVCPCRAIVITGATKHDFKKFRCSYCALCEKACPKGAIKFRNAPDNHPNKLDFPNA